MAYRDALTTFADDVNCPTNTAETTIGVGVDLLTAKDIGNGQPIYLNVIFGEGGDVAGVRGTAPTAASFPSGTGTFTITLRGSNTDTTPDSSDPIIVSASVDIASIRDRTMDKMCIAVPATGRQVRYYGITARRTTTGSGGTITAWLSYLPLGIPAHYPDANN